MADTEHQWACRLCGRNRSITNITVDGERFDACCEECAYVAGYMPRLGRAIRSFARRCEVEALVETVRDAACWPSPRVQTEDEWMAAVERDAERMNGALTRLAALAIEGAGR